MNRGKVKNILIVLFLFVDIFLLSNIVISSHKAKNVSPQIISSTVNVLKKQGITINPDIIPKKNKSVKYAEAENAVTDIFKFSKQILGDDITYLSDTEYSSPNGTLSFNGDNFTYTNTQVSKINVDEKSAISYVKEYLSELGFDISHSIIKTEKIQNGFRITLENKMNSLADFTSSLILDVTGVKTDTSDTALHITYFSGSWFNKLNSDRQGYDLKSITAVLTDFISYISSDSNAQISNLELGYTVFDDGAYHKTAVLIPAWKITLSDDTSYILDARNSD